MRSRLTFNSAARVPAGQTVARSLAVLVAALSALGATAPAASAKTFCVAKPGCVGDVAANVNAAASSANNNPGPDRIEIGAGEFTNVGMTIAGWGGSAEIVGAGRGKTILRNASSAAVTLSADNARVSDLTVISSETSALGIDLGGAATSAERVEVVGPSVATAASDAGIILRRGGTVRDAIVTMPLHPQYADYAISVYQSNASDPGAVPTVIEDVRLTAGYGIFVKNTNRDVAIRRGVISAGIYGLYVIAPIPHVTVEHVAASAFTDGAPNSTANGIGVYGSEEATTPTVVDLRHVSASAVHTKGRGFSARQFGTAAPLTVNAVDSAFFGGRDDNAGTTGSFDIELGGFKTGIQFHAARSAWRSRNVWVPWQQVGPEPHRLIDDGGNVDLSANTAPAVADLAAGDLRPVGGSVLIDNGTPSLLGGTLDSLDAIGAARVTDGDSDGDARRDIGAFEAPAGTSGAHVTPAVLPPPCTQCGNEPPPEPRAVTKITQPFRGKTKTRRKTVSGTATGAVSGVRLSITRKTGKACEVLSAKQKWVKSTKLASGKCAPLYTLLAKGTTTWTLTLRKALPKGSYEISSRGEGSVGLEASPGTVTLKRK